MEQRISLITLGVGDLDRARRFYERLGWRRAGASVEACAFYQLNGCGLALYGRDALAQDMGLSFSGGAAPVTISQNVRSPEAVEALYTEMIAAGAASLKAPHRAHWGGVIAFVADPDGHVWEIAHNPYFPLTAAGDLLIDGEAS